MKTRQLLSTAVAALAMCAGFAQASPLVTQWTVTDFTTFDLGSVLPGPMVSPNPVLSGGGTQLHWGTAATSAGQSGLVINNFGAVLVDTEVLTSTVSLTHKNFPIFAPSLQSVDINAFLTLTGTTPAGGPTLGAPIMFQVDFIETPNNPSSGICADGTLRIGGPLNSNGCADIFVITNPALDFVLPYDSDGAINGYDPRFYSVQFSGSGFGPLSNGACAAASALPGCQGFRTGENQATTANFNIFISAVPEPGSLALIGLALTGLALSRRRQNKQAPQ